MTQQRTYWHLQGQGRVPSAYEIGTSKLLYYPGRGFEVSTPIAGWYERYQTGSRLRASWQTFRDPRATTYASYVQLQHEQEVFVDQILRSMDETSYDRDLSCEWVGVLESVLPVLRYPSHALHMLACYVGHMASEGRLVVAGAFQAMDEVRRIQRLAYRMRQLQTLRPSFGTEARQLWQQGAAWQPLRQLLERLLVTYDFGEAAIACNLVVKPAFDRLFMHHFVQLAVASGDRLLGEIFHSLDRDCRWHAECAQAFVATAIQEDTDNLTPIGQWVRLWWPPTQQALQALLTAWSLDSSRARAIASEVETACRARWVALGVDI